MTASYPLATLSLQPAPVTTSLDTGPPRRSSPPSAARSTPRRAHPLCPLHGAGALSPGSGATTDRRSGAPAGPATFLTAPETHPFFGITLARQIAECWERLDRPRALRHPRVRRGHRRAGLGHHRRADAGGARLSRRPANTAWSSRTRTDCRRRSQAYGASGLGRRRARGGASGDDLEPITGVVLANEVADAFGVHRLIWRGRPAARGLGRLARWSASRRRSASSHRRQPPLLRRRCCASTASRWPRVTASRSLPRPRPGSPQRRAVCARGYAIVIDYGYPAAELYRGHRLRGTGTRLSRPHGQRRPVRLRRRAGPDGARRLHRPTPRR